eukprot:136749-Rhodomonas_salina.1
MAGVWRRVDFGRGRAPGGRARQGPAPHRPWYCPLPPYGAATACPRTGGPAVQKTMETVKEAGARCPTFLRAPYALPATELGGGGGTACSMETGGVLREGVSVQRMRWTRGGGVPTRRASPATIRYPPTHRLPHPRYPHTQRCCCGVPRYARAMGMGVPGRRADRAQAGRPPQACTAPYLPTKLLGMPGTDLAYAATRCLQTTRRQRATVASAICLRARYGMRSTDVAMCLGAHHGMRSTDV